jgi:hypothetical protein
MSWLYGGITPQTFEVQKSVLSVAQQRPFRLSRIFCNNLSLNLSCLYSGSRSKFQLKCHNAGFERKETWHIDGRVGFVVFVCLILGGWQIDVRHN